MLGNWVLRSACRQAQQWLEAGIALPPVAINVSALQFKAPRELEKEIDTVLAETGLAPGLLEIEMTETALMGTSSAHDNVVDRLRERGVRIAIDDFGTGYSSLLYLRRFPVDRIKIAQEFVKDIGVEPNDTAIVKAAIGLARELGIGVSPKAWKRQISCVCSTAGVADRHRDSTLPHPCRPRIFCRCCAAAASCAGWRDRRPVPATRVTSAL